MAADVEAVIAALRVALDEAQKSDEDFWQVSAVNRWIDQLPGIWMGRWRDLKLAGDTAGEVDREQFVGHVRAVVAFLEASRMPTPRVRKWWSLRRRNSTALPATQAAATPARAAAKPINLLRVRKPMPGLH
jgi:hypothetical protein